MIKLKSLEAGINAAYDLSQPQGLGFLHFRNEPLTEEQVKKLTDNANERGSLYFDYVLGRAVKLSFKRVEGEWFADLGENWFDHSSSQLSQFKALAAA